MTMFWRKRRAQFDAEADSFLDKLKASGWTGLILIAGVVVFLAALAF